MRTLHGSCPSPQLPCAASDRHMLLGAHYHEFTSKSYVKISAVPITHLRESLLTSASASPCSQTGGCHAVLAFIGQHNVVCCHRDNIDQFPLKNYFPAQSRHFRYGSAAPCPTLLWFMLPATPKDLRADGYALPDRLALL